MWSIFQWKHLSGCDGEICLSATGRTRRYNFSSGQHSLFPVTLIVMHPVSEFLDGLCYHGRSGNLLTTFSVNLQFSSPILQHIKWLRKYGILQHGSIFPDIPCTRVLHSPLRVFAVLTIFCHVSKYVLTLRRTPWRGGRGKPASLYLHRKARRRKKWA
jgi:hypothetical protein